MGFAEEGEAGFESVEAGVAWTRTLGVLRSAFKLEVDLEGAVMENLKGKFENRTQIPLFEMDRVVVMNLPHW